MIEMGVYLIGIFTHYQLSYRVLLWKIPRIDYSYLSYTTVHNNTSNTVVFMCCNTACAVSGQCAALARSHSADCSHAFTLPGISWYVQYMLIKYLYIFGCSYLFKQPHESRIFLWFRVSTWSCDERRLPSSARMKIVLAVELGSIPQLPISFGPISVVSIMTASITD